MVNATPRLIYPREIDAFPSLQAAGSAPEQACTCAVSTPGLSSPKRVTIPTVQSVETLCYKPEVRVFDTRCGQLNYFFIDLLLMAAVWFGDTQHVTDMRTGISSGGGR